MKVGLADDSWLLSPASQALLQSTKRGLTKRLSQLLAKAVLQQEERWRQGSCNGGCLFSFARFVQCLPTAVSTSWGNLLLLASPHNPGTVAQAFCRRDSELFWVCQPCPWGAAVNASAYPHRHAEVCAGAVVSTGIMAMVMLTHTNMQRYLLAY